MIKTIMKPFMKSPEYDGYKTEIRVLQTDLRSKGSRTLREDEKIGYWKKYLRIAKGIRKKKWQRNEGEKLKKNMTDLERLLKLHKIIEEIASTETSSKSKSYDSKTHLLDKSYNLRPHTNVKSKEGFGDTKNQEIHKYGTCSKPDPESTFNTEDLLSLEALNPKNAEEMKLKMHHHHNKSSTSQVLPQIHSAISSRNKNQDETSNIHENPQISVEIIPGTSGSSLGFNQDQWNEKTKERNNLGNVDRKKGTSSGAAESYRDDGVKYSQVKERKSVDASKQATIAEIQREKEPRSRYGANAGTRIVQSVVENKSAFYDSDTHTSRLASPSYSHQAPESNIRNGSEFKNYLNPDCNKEYSKFVVEDEKARGNKTILDIPEEIRRPYEEALDAAKEMTEEYEPDVEMQEMQEQNTIDQHGYSRNEELTTEQKRNDQMNTFRVKELQPFHNVDAQDQNLMYLNNFVKLQEMEEKRQRAQTYAGNQNSRRFQGDKWRTSDTTRQCYDPHTDTQSSKDRQDAIKMKEIQARAGFNTRHGHPPNSGSREDSSPYRQQFNHHGQDIAHHQGSRVTQHFRHPDYDFEPREHNRPEMEKFHDPGSHYDYTHVEQHSTTKRIEKIEEQKPLEILDVHKFFRDDFNVNSIDESLDDLTKIKILEDAAKKYEETVSQFAEEKYSIEYFVLDEKLMRLIEKLDKMKCQDDRTATDKKVQVIEYIKNLHNTLDERAIED